MHISHIGSDGSLVSAPALERAAERWSFAAIRWYSRRAGKWRLRFAARGTGVAGTRHP